MASLLFSMSMANLQAQGPVAGLAGTWLGAIQAGGGIEIHLVFHVAAAPGGSLTGTMDSPDQGATGLPLSAVKVDGKNITMQLTKPVAEYTGEFDASGNAITGTWHQGPAAIPLNLKRVDKVPEPVRPQEPKPPFPYKAEDVIYPSKAAGVQLAGTLTEPNTGGPFAAVLLITGSGAQDRDEAILGHKPFLVISDYLTRHGVAVLRVDDRGTGKSTGTFRGSTTADFVQDAAGSVAWLKGRPEIDAKRIGLLGHSEGAIIAPILATESHDVAFIVMLAGTGVPGRDVLKAQAAAIARSAGAPEELIRKNAALQDELFSLAAEKLTDTEREAKLHELATSFLAQLPEAERAKAGAIITAQIENGGSPWMRYFMQFDPSTVLRKLTTPALVMNGSLDQQVLPEQNLPAIAAALEAAHNADYEIVKLPGLNHLFQTAKTGAPSEYAGIEETFSPVALKVIGDWVERQGMR